MFCKAISLPFARPLRIVLRQSVGMLAAAEVFAVLPQAVGHIAQMPSAISAASRGCLFAIAVKSARGER